MTQFKMLAVALGAVVVSSSALAAPTLWIWDTGGGAGSGSLVPVPAGTGIATYANPTFDGAWSVVITTSKTKPATGSATAPMMDLIIQAMSLGVAGRDLHVSWSDDGFGPFNASLAATLVGGHVVSGTGSGLQYQTYYQAGAGVWAAAAQPGGSWNLYTDSGVLPPPTYVGSVTGGTINQATFGLTEYITITSTPGAAYSLDASIEQIPEPSTTMLLLGAAVSGLAFLRRKVP